MSRTKNMSTLVRDAEPVIFSLASILDKLSANLGLSKERIGEKIELQGHNYYLSLEKKGRELSYADRVASFTFTSEDSEKPTVLNYQLKARYLHGQIDFLKNSKTHIGEMLAKEYQKDNLEDCMRHAFSTNEDRLVGVIKTGDIQATNEIYKFIIQHILA